MRRAIFSHRSLVLGLCAAALLGCSDSESSSSPSLDSGAQPGADDDSSGTDDDADTDDTATDDDLGEDDDVDSDDDTAADDDVDSDDDTAADDDVDSDDDTAADDDVDSDDDTGADDDASDDTPGPVDGGLLDAGPDAATEGTGDAGGGAGGAGGSGGAGGASGGSGGSGGAGGNPSVPGSAPLLATPETWTWFPLDGMQCADGSETGFGVNLVEGATEITIFLDGGGACTNALACALLDVPTSFGSSDFTERVAELDQAGFFQRDDADNPLAPMSWIYVPYCTGDVHAGNHASTGGQDLAFVGHQNMLAVLERLRAAYADLDLVVLAGGSAGGFGTLFNFHDTALTFPEATSVLLDDSGPVLDTEWMTPSFQNQTFGAWDVEVGIPAECPDVLPGSIDYIYECLSELHPDSRFGLVTSDADPVNRRFLGTTTTPMSEADYRDGIADLQDHLEGLDGWASFVLESNTEHVLGLNNPMSSIRVPDNPSGTTLSEFVRGVITGTDFESVP